MILCEGVKFRTLSLTGSKCTHKVIYLFKQTIKKTILSVNCAMVRWRKHEKLIYYVSTNEKNKNNKSKCICTGYEMLMQKQAQIGLPRRRM